MEINNDLTNALQNIRIASNSGSSNLDDLVLKLGQIVSAKVLNAQQAGLTTLLINNTQVQARTQLALQQGQLLQLLVEKSGDEVVLKLQDHDIQQAIIKQNLREALPRQLPLDQALAKLTQTLREATVQSNLPKHIVQMVRQAIEKLPSARDVQNPEGLKQIIRNTGTFTERNLANIVMQQSTTPKGQSSLAQNNAVTQTIETDLKLILDQLKQQLTQAKNELTAKLPEPTSSQTNNTSNSTTTNTRTPAANSTQTPPDTSDDATNNTSTTKSNSAIASPANMPTKNTTNETTKSPNALTTNTNTKTSTQPNANTSAKSDLIGTRSSPLPATLLNDEIVPTTTDPTKQTATSEHDPQRVLNEKNNQRAMQADARILRDAKENSASTMNQSLKEIISTMENLVKSVDSALSRTQLHQLHNAQESEQNRFAWMFEIPLRNGEKLDLLKMRIEREGASGRKQNTDMPITVTLEVDLDHIGAVQAKVVLVKASVNVSFWAERQNTYQMMCDELDELKTRLQKSGLNAEHIVAHHGQRPSINSAPLPSSGLLDLKA